VVPGGDEIWDYPAVLLFGHMKAIGDENLIFDVLVDLAANLPPTDDDVV
jgi:hypothetical protein